MKHLWLIGESLPLKQDGTQRRALRSTNLPETLVPLDPRHGVFPNLVMKPLFAAGYSLSQKRSDQLLTFFQEIAAVVADQSQRRLNVFENRATKPKKRSPSETKTAPAPEIFEIDHNKMGERWEAFNPARDLWLVFGHQTNFGLLWWLTDSEYKSTIEKEKIAEFSERFTKAVFQVVPEYAPAQPDALSGRIGLLHRLCTEPGDGGVLARAIDKLGTQPRFPCERIVASLRSVVPLLHNEGYQDGSNPTGNAQSHFVRYAVKTTANGDLYWQVMGNAIASRVVGDFVE